MESQNMESQKQNSLIVDIHNWIIDFHNKMDKMNYMDIHNCIMNKYVCRCTSFDQYAVMAAHYAIMDIHNWIVYVHNWIMDIHP